MKYLLDTHTFIWLNGKPSRLSQHVAALCSHPANTLLLSLASGWEMQIKLGLGNLTLPAPLAHIIAEQQNATGVELLSIELSHLLAMGALPYHHKDPFDRLLVAQAKTEQIPLVSDDPQIARYGISVVW